MRRLGIKFPSSMQQDYLAVPPNTFPVYPPIIIKTTAAVACTHCGIFCLPKRCALPGRIRGL